MMKFTEEFDFNAMNEKFNKDEVWGTLGKSNRSGSKEKDGNTTDEDEIEEENDPNLPKVDVKVRFPCKSANTSFIKVATFHFFRKFSCQIYLFDHYHFIINKFILSISINQGHPFPCFLLTKLFFAF